MKNVLKLNQQFYHPQELIETQELFVHNYDNNQYHGALNNLSPADVNTSRTDKIFEKRALLKEKTINKKRQLYNQQKIYKSYISLVFISDCTFCLKTYKKFERFAHDIVINIYSFGLKYL